MRKQGYEKPMLQMLYTDIDVLSVSGEVVDFDVNDFFLNDGGLEL